MMHTCFRFAALPLYKTDLKKTFQTVFHLNTCRWGHFSNLNKPAVLPVAVCSCADYLSVQSQIIYFPSFILLE